ncbi:hypothetical protein PGT21_004928 [Puccinia graminis f. sp. tritici]|uniref:Uncharacterized protein n=1 Tax=Puccinia graminis f. sp. tritici TaxID=56615 RepID=A0A5B0NBJ9_PUCGR|nr:hypothetical protein PGT21_004928 [Puccinia graminis f. sp. tritici]
MSLKAPDNRIYSDESTPICSFRSSSIFLGNDLFIPNRFFCFDYSLFITHSKRTDTARSLNNIRIHSFLVVLSSTPTESTCSAFGSTSICFQELLPVLKSPSNTPIATVVQKLLIDQRPVIQEFR